MIYRFGDFELDSDRFELRESGKAVAAEPQVLALLFVLVDAGDRLVTKDEIVERVWRGRIVSDAAISSRIKSARQIVRDSGDRQELIRTVRGKGVRFLAEVEKSADPQADGSGAAPDGTGASGNLPPQQVRFCTSSDGTGLAYSVVGNGPVLVKTANWLNHLEFEWESPIWKHWLDELAGRHTLLRYDERGNGMSDWRVGDLSIDALLEDLETVIDAAGFERFDLLGLSQGCAVSIAYAVKHPERVRRMVLYGGYATGWRIRADPEELAMRELMVAAIETGWGRSNPAFRQLFTTLYFPDATVEQMNWFNELQRVSASPTGARQLLVALGNIDVRDLLGQVRAPTLVIHSRNDTVVPANCGRYLASKIPNARFVELESGNHIILEQEPAWTRFRQHLRAFLEQPD